jgi:hypothetical protein
VHQQMPPGFSKFGDRVTRRQAASTGQIAAKRWPHKAAPGRISRDSPDIRRNTDAEKKRRQVS